MNFFSKLKFLLRKPKIIIVTGEGRTCAKEAIYQVLKEHFKIGKDIFIFDTDLTSPKVTEKFKSLIKNSSLTVLVVTSAGDIPPDKNFFPSDKEKTTEIRKLAKSLPSYSYLVLNFDDETVREIKYYDQSSHPKMEKPIAHCLTFGFQEGANFQATDIKLDHGTNFKLNYEGSVIPFWLANLFRKEQIYSALAAATVGTIFDLNLVEISQALKNYH